MSLPLYSQNEYQRLHVQTPTVSYNKCNNCTPAVSMPDILAPMNADAGTKEGFSPPAMPNMYLMMFFLIIAYLVLVGYMASYKPHSDGSDIAAAGMRPGQ